MFIYVSLHVLTDRTAGRLLVGNDNSHSMVPGFSVSDLFRMVSESLPIGNRGIELLSPFIRTVHTGCIDYMERGISSL